MKERHTSPRRPGSTKHRTGPLRKHAPSKPEKTLAPSNGLALQHFVPDPGAVYTLETVAQLSGVPRRTVLIYCKHKFISPMVEPSISGYWFNADTIQRLREIQYLRTCCHDELQSLRTILGLLEEIKFLRATVREHEHDV